MIVYFLQFAKDDVVIDKIEGLENQETNSQEEHEKFSAPSIPTQNNAYSREGQTDRQTDRQTNR